MTEEEIKAFLNRSPARIGVVATSDPDGSPHLVPVWYRFASGTIRIWSLERRRWVQNLLHFPKTAFSVQDDAMPYGAVVIKGASHVATGADSTIDEEIAAITTRYLGTDKSPGYIARWPELRTIVTITPQQTFAWTEGS